MKYVSTLEPNSTEYNGDDFYALLGSFIYDASNATTNTGEIIAEPTTSTGKVFTHSFLVLNTI